jgi:hypothetical protein
MVARDIDEVIQYLDRIIAEYREQRSRLAFFPALYRTVTLRVRSAIDTGGFADGERMNRLDTAFANRYFAALASVRAGLPPPRCWRVAFGAEFRSGTMILQHLLLGMNAHINFDLPIATVAVAPHAELPALQDDFLRINAILGAALDDAQAAVGEFSPLLDVLDRIGGRSDEAIVTFSIVNARDEAWHEATRLAEEVGARRERSILSLDRRVTLLAERVLLPGGHCGAAIELIARTEQDDARIITDGLLAVA